MNRFYKLLKDDLSTMSTKENFWYWIFPFLLLIILMIFYFLGTHFLVELVVPSSNREYGLLENIQLVLILGIIIMSFYVVFTDHALLQKLGFVVLGLLAIFIFLEEMDYGDHFIKYFTDGEKRSIFFEKYGKVNVHNREGDRLTYMRRTPYVIIFMLFTIFPFINKKYLHPILSYLIPKPRMALMIVLFLFAYFSPRLPVDYHIFDVGSLGIGDNIGEFTEMIVYYIFFIYVYHLVFDKKWTSFSGLKQTT